MKITTKVLHTLTGNTCILLLCFKVCVHSAKYYNGNAHVIWLTVIQSNGSYCNPDILVSPVCALQVGWIPD